VEWLGTCTLDALMKQSLKAEAECVDVWGGRRLRLESPILARMLVQAIQTFPAVANESKIETHTGLTIDFFSLIANSTDRQAQKTDAVPKPPDTGFIVFTKTVKIGQFTVQNSNKIDQTKMVYQPLGFYDFDFHFFNFDFFY
jgi:hypothetical protein